MFYQENFAGSACSRPGCTHENENLLLLPSTCGHADGPVVVRYSFYRKCLHVFCAECGAHAFDVAVASLSTAGPGKELVEEVSSPPMPAKKKPKLGLVRNGTSNGTSPFGLAKSRKKR